MTTLQQVADAAGVSLATASRVISGAGSRVVRADLAARVLATAAELRYVAHGPAQALARASTDIVGLIVHDVDDPYFSAIAAGAMRVALADDLLVLVAATFRDPATERRFIARLRAQRARAILLAGGAFTHARDAGPIAEELAAFTAGGGQVVTLGGHDLGTDAVHPDNAGGGLAAARRFLAGGHTRIGVVSGPRTLVSVADRLRGFRQGLRAAGLRAAGVVEADFTRDGAYAASMRLFEKYPDVTGVFVLSDVMAIGVLAAARALGRRVPEDVAVMGFGDIPIAADLSPALTTVRLDPAELGAQAMRLVVEGMASGPRVVRLPAVVVERGSVG